MSNREALRRREHIRALLRRWEEQGRDPTLLFPPGLPLEEGRELLAHHGDVLIDDVQPYIAASLTADEERRQREFAAAQRLVSERRKRASVTIGLSLVALLMAAGAGWQWLEAQAQTLRANDERARAERNLTSAERPASGLVFDLAQGLKSVSGVSNDTIRRRVDDLLTELAGGEDAPPLLLHIRIATSHEFAQAYMAQGDLGAARAAAEQAKDIAQILAQRDPDNAGWQYDVGISHERIGDVLQAQGDLSGALRAYQAALEIIQRLTQQDQSNSQWQRSLAWVETKFNATRAAHPTGQ